MATKFSIPLRQDVDQALERIRSSIVETGGEFSGDVKSGVFSGSTAMGLIAGNYLVEDEEILIVITKKPFMLSKIAIKSTMQEYLS